MEAATGEKTFPLGSGSVGEKTNCQSSEKTVEAVNTDSTNRIVHFQHFVDKFDTEDNDETGENTDDGCGSRGNGVTAGSDGYQTCQRSV